MNIYLDTNLWNLLCDRGVDAQECIALLDVKNIKLVLSTHTIYELAETFRSSKAKASERGRQLFSYIKTFVDLDVPCAKENTELLAAEMWALKLRTSTVDGFLREQDYELLRREVDRLAAGDFDDRADKFIKERTAFASNTRAAQVRHLEDRADIKRQLKSVGTDAIELWLQTASNSKGIDILTFHIQRMFPEAPVIEAMEYAKALLASPVSRIAKGLVRADLYYNWRCGCHDSTPKDLIDDIYHVLNSTHCEIYATEEKGQLEYSGLLLTTRTRTVIYDGETPLEQWLVTRTG